MEKPSLSPKKPQQRQENISFLERLRRLPKMAQLSVVAAHLLLTSGEKAEAKFIEGTPTYAEAHKILKDSVKNDKWEQGAICVVTQKGKGYCFAPKQIRKADAVATPGVRDELLSKCSEISLQENSDSHWYVLNIHTHPVHAIKYKNERFKIAPPSIDDIKTAIADATFLYERSKSTEYANCEQKVVNQVYDLNGVWSYSLRGEAEHYVKYIKAYKELRDIKKQIEGDIKEIKDIYISSVDRYVLSTANALEKDGANTDALLSAISFSLDVFAKYDIDAFNSVKTILTGNINEIITDDIERIEQDLDICNDMDEEWCSPQKIQENKQLLSKLYELRNALDEINKEADIDASLHKIKQLMQSLKEVSTIFGQTHYLDHLSKHIYQQTIKGELHKIFENISDPLHSGFLKTVELMCDTDIVNTLGIDVNTVNKLLNIKKQIEQVNHLPDFIKTRKALEDYYNVVWKVRHASESKSDQESVYDFFKRHSELWNVYKQTLSRLGIEITFKEYNDN